ncbi:MULTISPECIES: hypothetical protein [Vibrio harveyi group]|uniref:Cap15 family cyclic dinucleotide receptor domain-containing protein n=1 Tax=Vibrio harveyi group TaxID=717610 RepID=UPI00076DBBAB|nr:MULTISPECIES: hypothetical protein [Vibrio harveyi group]PNP21487.1 hypothetical protein AL471_011730 [Vibrio alginolyticus]TOI39107.1 hypothetical protein CGI60_23115 [Vibrio parahaemolyticus]TOI98368.1 hypothetical protein CGI48_22300 [Vibrio parahaemolyticus]HBC3912525.1 hypothetical protein [Vibrio parahaemolyticus]
MWKVFPKFGLAKLLMFVICALVTIGGVWVTRGWSGVTEFFERDGFDVVTRLTMPVLVLFILLTWLMGTYVWRVVWKIPYIGTTLLNQKVCPDLNGTWVGETVSTFSDNDGNPYRKAVTLDIKASFFNFDIRLISDDQYQRSTVVQSEIYKDQRDGSFYLSYIYESVVDQPLKTDDSKFDGSAKLHIRFDSSEITLVGVYWTNRCWQKGMQTAGTIKLSKK